MDGARTVYGGLILGIACLAAAFAPSVAAAAEVNIYSYRKEQLIRPQLEAFKTATGIRYNLITGLAGGLIQRLMNEGINSPADVLLTVDAGRLARAKGLGLTQAVRSRVLEAAIPARYRDPEGHWFGLGVRARTIFIHVDRVRPGDLSSYESLADPRWRRRILVRSSNNIYNQSLLSSLVHHLGKAKAEAWAKGVVANFARKPQGGDTDQLRALAAGEGDVAISNHYYFARLLASKKAKDKRVIAKVKPIWPNQAGRGVHVNVSGAAVTMSAKNRASAIQLLEFFSSREAQRIYAEVGHEFPIREDAETSEIVASLGWFKRDAIDLEILGRNNATAVRIFDRVGWR